MTHYLSTVLRAMLYVTVQDMGIIYQKRAAKRFGGRCQQILKSSPLAHEAEAILSVHYHIVTLAASSTFQPRRHDYYLLLIFRVQVTASVLSMSFTCARLYTTPHLITISPWLPRLYWINASLQRPDGEKFAFLSAD